MPFAAAALGARTDWKTQPVASVANIVILAIAARRGMVMAWPVRISVGCTVAL